MSKTIVISDTHFTKLFQPKRYKKLVGLINNADQVVLNGDFWEGMAISFDDFMNSKWKQLFPLLKEKKAIYVYGNHDDPALSDDRVYEFCETAVEEYALKTPKRTYYFNHGQDFLTPRVKDRSQLEKKARKLITRLEIFIAGIIQGVGFALLGPNILPKKFNEMTIFEREKIAPMEYLLVCGHSHKPQYQPNLNFIDIGFFNYGWANYMLIDDKGDFEFHSEKY